ncbi:MAG: hypothetical protein IJE68_00180 [Clostridia bacterium]|nr:hypothetical protein [Clostridia bacterium]
MNISINTRQAYTEIDNFIELLDNYNKNKIPLKLREFFKQEKDNNYVKNIDANLPIKEQNLKEETLTLIALLNLQYWCEDEKEKQRLKEIYARNEEIYQDDLRKKYNPDKLFKERNNFVQENYEEKQLIVIKKESFIKKIILKIKSVLNMF